MFQPNKGGHAPGCLRDTFVGMIDDPSWRRGAMPSAVTVDDEPRPLRWLLGQLWNCTDTLPGSCCAGLDIRAGSTYAQAVRGIAAALKE